ncbi:MAG: DUF4406 domain-containing protein [Methanobrevibacter sp.]|nr:DUF4406 domain-containing protein [Methanobrevibacter sp.]
MTTKIMISRPMKGKTKEDIDKDTNEMANLLFDYYGDDNIEIMASIVENHIKKSELECLSESIFFMSQSDILAMGFGWENSRGCKLEHEIAKAYNLPVVYLDNIKEELDISQEVVM